MLAQTNSAPRTLTVAITGASGSIFPRLLLDRSIAMNALARST